MDSTASNYLDIFEIYRQFCYIMSGVYANWEEGYRMVDDLQKAKSSKEALNQLSKLIESKVYPRMSVFDEVFKLMSRLELKVDFYEFSRFYDFVFFLCRDKGQKNITVSRAVSAWRLVLAGRFRLLNQWCDFVEKNQRHNISEDTWRQVLAFSRCVHENLEGYDPEGAWPVLIDDFVDHMYRIKGSNDTANLFCNCNDSEVQPFEEPFPGLKTFPGLKRKMEVDVDQGQESEPMDDISIPGAIYKKKRLNLDDDVCTGTTTTDDYMEMTKHTKSPCAVEGCLLKGFAGLFSSRMCLQYDPERRVS